MNSAPVVSQAPQSSPKPANEEGVKTGFLPEGMLFARRKSWEALERIAQAIRPGQLEEEATARAQEILRELGSPAFWHRTYVRFGANTLCTYSDQAAPGHRLGENDIYFIDIGPVWENPEEGGARYEGDAGMTGFVGSDPEHAQAAEAVREIFEATRQEWKSGARSGKDLYDWMAAETVRRGWILNQKADGHRISEFPHRLYSTRGIAELDYKPAADIWVLEVQIRHPSRPFGAFYEDILS